MPLLTLRDVARSHADLHILQGVSLSLELREKVGLIGRNGSGKTTLLRLIARLDDPDRGRIALARWARAAYLPQSPEGAAEERLMPHVLAAAADVHALERRVVELERRMARPEVHDDPDRLAAVMEEYAHARERFEHAGGFTLEARARVVLGGLGFAPEDYERPLAALSGGWRVRAALARALLTEPDLLLLDEPTNHLDLAATEWLEDYLRDFPGAVILVSHDRFLLDAVTTRTLELEDGRLDDYPAAYTAYTAARAQRAVQARETWERRQEEIARLEDYIRRYRVGRATQAKSREKMLARVEAAPVEPPRTRPVMRISLGAAPPSGRLVVRLREVSKHFGRRELFHGVSLEIHRGERIGLLGANGAGKSTLLRMVAEMEPASEGHITLGAGVRPRYFAQESTTALDPSHTVLEEILADRPMTPQEVRTHLGRFLFSGEEVFKRVEMLSGGERQRLSLARLLLERPNLLLLDEPTNHLDIPSREALEGALREFSGTMIVATHDRYLLDRLASRILTLEDGRVADFRGTYHEMRERRAIARNGSAPGGASVRSSGARGAPPTAQRENAVKSAARLRGRGTDQPERSFDEVAAEIDAVERDLAEAGRWLADPDLYRDPERAAAMRARYEAGEQRLRDLFAALDEVIGDRPEEPGTARGGPGPRGGDG